MYSKDFVFAGDRVFRPTEHWGYKHLATVDGIMETHPAKLRHITLAKIFVTDNEGVYRWYFID
jgi:hypothetical protein